MLEPPPLALDLAERVAAAASELGIQTALIGALALAAHKHVRGTEDIDLACSVDPYGPMLELERVLASQGLKVKLRLPDDDDPLGGVLVVWQYEDEEAEPIEPVELVNFFNPHRPKRNPGKRAIERSLPLGHGSLRYVGLPDLIALKLYAGSVSDHGDIIEVLSQNPDANLDEIRATAEPYDRDHQLARLIEASRARSSARDPASS